LPLAPLYLTSAAAHGTSRVLAAGQQLLAVNVYRQRPPGHGDTLGGAADRKIYLLSTDVQMALVLDATTISLSLPGTEDRARDLARPIPALLRTVADGKDLEPQMSRMSACHMSHLTSHISHLMLEQREVAKLARQDPNA